MNRLKFKFIPNSPQLNYLVTRELRSLRVLKPKIKLPNEEEIHQAQLKAAQKEKARQLEIWRQEDEAKLTKWTNWRMQEEDRLTKLHMPMPLSLTGFGDGAKPRYWTIRLRKAFAKWSSLQKLQELPFCEKIPLSVRHILEKHADTLEDRHRPLCDKLAQSKLKQKETAKELALSKLYI